MKKLDHYLISLPVLGGWMHCYLMTKDKRHFEAVVNEMMDFAEKEDMLVPMSSMSMCTGPLTPESIAKVRDVIVSSNLCPEAPRLWKEATDFHRTAFVMGKDVEACAVLNALH